MYVVGYKCILLYYKEKIVDYIVKRIHVKLYNILGKGG